MTYIKMRYIIIFIILLLININPVLLQENVYVNNNTTEKIIYILDAKINFIDNTDAICEHELAIGCYNHDTGIVYVNNETGNTNKIVYHELGHKFFFEIMSNKERLQWVEITSDNPKITIYARHSPAENFAESFAEYYLDFSFKELDNETSGFLEEMITKYNLPTEV